MVNWDCVLETIAATVLFIYYIAEGVLCCVVPSRFRRKKKFQHETHGRDIALITGAGGGIGRQLAQKFYQLGAIVVLWDIDGESNRATAQTLKEEAGDVEKRVFCYTVDVGNRTDVYSTADQVRHEIGHVTILVNNAGIMNGKRLLDSPDDIIKQTISVNTMSHFWAVKAFLPDMLEKDRGHIVGMASLSGLTGSTHFVDYCTSKFALIGFYESLDLELKSMHKRIPTTVICPFLVKTLMTAGVTSVMHPLVEREALDPDYVASQVIEAVQKNETIRFIPRWIYILHVAKCILPAKIWCIAQNIVGTGKIMQTFKPKIVRRRN